MNTELWSEYSISLRRRRREDIVEVKVKGEAIPVTGPEGP
jgi:hypothetical protein